MKHSRLKGFLSLMVSTAFLFACDEDVNQDSQSNNQQTALSQKSNSLEFVLGGSTTDQSSGGTSTTDSAGTSSGDLTFAGTEEDASTPESKRHRRVRAVRGQDTDLTSGSEGGSGDLTSGSEGGSKGQQESEHPVVSDVEGTEYSVGNLGSHTEEDQDQESDEGVRLSEQDRSKNKGKGFGRSDEDSDHHSDEDSDHHSDEDSDHHSDEDSDHHGCSGDSDAGGSTGDISNGGSTGDISNGGSTGDTVCVAVANQTQTLYAGQNIDAGTVSVSVDGADLVVTYQTKDGWQLMETHLWVGSSLQTLPTTVRGNPQVGLFPYTNGDVGAQSSYVVRIPLTELNFACPQDTATYLVAAHASMRLPKADGSFQQETGWGAGTRLVESGNWATYFSFDTSCDCTVPPPAGEQTCETAFAYTNTAACFLDLDLNQDTRRDFSRWGWTLGPIAEGTYQYDVYGAAGQCDLSKGTLVGSMNVVYTQGTVTVSYTALPGFSFSEAQTYAGAEILPRDRNGNYTVAPGQYTVVESLASGSTSYTTSISGLSGDVYVVAHSVACGSQW